MAASTDPRQLLELVLARMGLDGGNARALANTRGVLDDLRAARERVDALEMRMGHGAPAGLGAGWPVTPPAGQPPRPDLVGVAPRGTGQPALGTSISGQACWHRQRRPVWRTQRSI
jgi:hypothetical protein